MFCNSSLESKMEITDQIETAVELDIYAVKMSSLEFEPFTCDICNESFLKKSHLTHHTNQHKYECDVCKKVFTQKCSLKTHYHIHDGTKPYKCNSCHRGFGDPSTLRKHSLIHSGIRPHVCPLCNRSFVQKVTLRKHLLTHTGEKAHVCETCGRGFAQKSTLWTHYKTHDFGSKRERRQNTSAQIPCIYPLKDESSDSVIGNVLDETDIHPEKIETIFSTPTSVENQFKSQSIKHTSHNEASKMSKLKQDDDGEAINVITDSDGKEMGGCSLFEDSNKDLHLECVSIKVESSNDDINSSPNIEDTSSIDHYTCYICGLHFPRNVLLIEHLNDHQNELSHVFPIVASNAQDTTVHNEHSLKTSVSQNHRKSYLNHEHVCECCDGICICALELEKRCEATLEQNKECFQNKNKVQMFNDLSCNVFVPENKRKQRVPRKVLQLPVMTDSHRLDLSEEKFIQNGQLTSISSKFGLNDRKKNSASDRKSPSKKLLRKYTVSSIQVIDPL